MRAVHSGGGWCRQLLGQGKFDGVKISPRRVVLLGLLIVLALVGCRSGNPAPDISEVNEIDLVITLLSERPRESRSDGAQKVWFFDPTERFSGEDRQRIRDTIDAPVEFYTDAWEPVVPGSSHYPEGEVSTSFSNMRKLKDDVIGIDVSGSSGLTSGTRTTLLFKWDGQNWVRTEPEQVGVTTTLAVY